MTGQLIKKGPKYNFLATICWEIIILGIKTCFMLKSGRMGS